MEKPGAARETQPGSGLGVLLVVGKRGSRKRHKLERREIARERTNSLA